VHDGPADDDPPPEPPVQPSSEDCCQGGCTHCVFDLYDEAMERYRERLRAWQQRQPASRIGPLLVSGQVMDLPSERDPRRPESRIVAALPPLSDALKRSCSVATILTALAGVAFTAACAQPRVVLISLDGAAPHLVEAFTRDGTLSADRGLGLLARQGVVAERNITANPSLTAVSHIVIATGSNPATNNIPGNTFHLQASPFTVDASGFGAPIGGYALHASGAQESPSPTAEPLWIRLRAAGKRVVAATWPGADGVDVRIPGLPAPNPTVQSAARRIVDYTVPFGAFGGVGARGFTLNASSFATAPATTVAGLEAAGRVWYGEVRETPTPIETMTIGRKAFAIRIAALDTSDDARINYDTLVFFDQTQGIAPGPFALPATGPAYVKATDNASGRFYFDGSSTKAGTAFYVTLLAPDLSNVHVVRYSANFIARNAPVIQDVDDVNRNVGFWAPQPDFRIAERLSPGFENFSDLELEAVYEDQVRTFVDYQVRVILHALDRNPDADLVMGYIEQPDGAGHQFLMTDPRQASNARDPTTIGANQDPAKRERYRRYLGNAYRTANDAVQRIIDKVGVDADGTPRSTILVVSDHGMAPFHTAVNLPAYLAARGFDARKVRAVTSGAAANVYINLSGRNPAGAVGPEEYRVLQQRIADALRDLTDSNPRYAMAHREVRVFDQIHKRPTPRDVNDPGFGLTTDDFIGQDSGDVFAVLALGYNFDGRQTPVVQRLGDEPASTPVLSVPNFYGSHGYDPRSPEMSVIFYAAGPQVCRQELRNMRNIDVAPTILRLFDVTPADTVQGRARPFCGR
jgi:predicted AlkP superfamily pyrophosphatase or phosphodiesterase